MFTGHNERGNIQKVTMKKHKFTCILGGFCMRSFHEDMVRLYVLLYLDNHGMPLRTTSLYVQRVT